MTSITHDCPFCGAKSSAFLIVSEIKHRGRKGTFSTLTECGVCRNIALAKLHDHRAAAGNRSTILPSDQAKKGRISDIFKIQAFHPEPSKLRIASEIPENVKTSMTEAEKAFAAGLYSAAGSCYRKAIERAVKHINPNGTGMLNKRIREIEKDGLLPSAMIELLDKVRLFGNASMHEDDFDPTKGDCEAARDFADLFLTYAFSLPAMIIAASENLDQ